MTDGRTIEWSKDDSFDITCDGCGRRIRSGQECITGIEPCCGGGCYRCLCRDCVKWAYENMPKED